MLGLSALGGFSSVQNSRMELLTSIQEQREFPYVRDKASSLHNAYLQVWKEAKIILTAIVCTYNFLVVLLNLGFLNKHFRKSSIPSHAVWSTLHSSNSQDTKGVCFYQSILDKGSPLACSVTKLCFACTVYDCSENNENLKLPLPVSNRTPLHDAELGCEGKKASALVNFAIFL